MMMKNPSRVQNFKTHNEYNAWYNENHQYLAGTTKDAERGSMRGKLFHIEESDTYFIWHVVPSSSRYLHGGVQASECYYRRIFFNIFGDYAKDINSEESIELKIVPARRDYLSWQKGDAIFLEPAGYNETEDIDENEIRQPYGYCILNNDNEGDKAPEYYDKLLVAIWDGNSRSTGDPCPTVDTRLSITHRYHSYQNGILINPKEKIKLKFLSDKIPDVRSVFHIRGKRYLCEKITATFNDDGMSQLLKGEFYPIVD